MADSPVLTDLWDPGVAQGWSDLGFEVVDDVVTIGAVAINLGGGEGVAWALRGLAADSLDGIAVRPSSAGDAQGPTAHPNGISSIDHVVVFTPDLHRTIEAFSSAGLELRRTRDIGGGRQQAFFWSGPVILEVVGNTEVNGPTGAAAIWGLALNCEDLEAAATVMGERLGPIKDAVQPGRQIATARTKAAGVGLTLAFMTPHQAPEG